MRYASGAAFRTALEERLRAESIASGTPLVRLRKIIAFDRFLARIVAAQPDTWLLKGGLALQLLTEGGSRATKDVDLLLRRTEEHAHAMLAEVARADLQDWFEFEVSEPVRQPVHEGLRMSVRSLLDGREFETFPVDVGIGDPVTAAPEPLLVTRLLEFAGVEPTLVPCYPLVQHVAEKLHAYSRPHGARENSRVKDYVDLVCLAERYAFEAEGLDQAIQAAFNARATHPLPPGLADPPASWTPEYRRMAKEVDADAGELAAASSLLRAFLEPMMNGSATGVWDPRRSEWR